MSKFNFKIQTLSLKYHLISIHTTKLYLVSCLQSCSKIPPMSPQVPRRKLSWQSTTHSRLHPHYSCCQWAGVPLPRASVLPRWWGVTWPFGTRRTQKCRVGVVSWSTAHPWVWPTPQCQTLLEAWRWFQFPPCHHYPLPDLVSQGFFCWLKDYDTPLHLI